MEKEILEGNKIIAEFIGLNFYPCDELEYHESWDWLMPVIEKIRFLGAIDFVISIGGSVVISWDDGTAYYNQNKGLGRSTIETTFESVVEFIKWYNDSSITKI